MVLVGYDQEQHHSFGDFDDCEELRYLTLLVPLSCHSVTLSLFIANFRHQSLHKVPFCHLKTWIYCFVMRSAISGKFRQSWFKKWESRKNKGSIFSQGMSPEFA